MTLESFSALHSPLAALQQLIEKLDDRGVIIGGIAASILGAPRLTADVDLVVLLPLSRLPELISLAPARA